MNIFALDSDPRLAARYHCDRHVVKMVLETAQLLSTALWNACPAEARRLSGAGLAYRPTHARHPCSLWLLESAANVRWLARLGLALADEYEHRYPGKVHASRGVIEACTEAFRLAFSERRCAIPKGARPTRFVQAMPAQHRREDPVEGYRTYYREAKAHLARWTHRRRPPWF